MSRWEVIENGLSADAGRNGIEGEYTALVKHYRRSDRALSLRRGGRSRSSGCIAEVLGFLYLLILEPLTGSGRTKILGPATMRKH